jgi:regulator of sigma E protease
MAGEAPDEANTNVSASADRGREFFAKPWYTRIAIAFAGPLMNYVLAAVLFFAILIIWGEPNQINKTEVGDVIAGMPAEKAGLKAGDKIISIQGETVEDFLAIKSKIHARPAQSTDVEILRDNQPLKITIVPAKDEAMGGFIGIKPAAPVNERHKIGVLASGEKALWQCWNITAFTVYYLGQKIWTRQISKADVAGPLGISQVIAKAVKSGAEDFFYLIGLISVSIGLFNLFPIPMLDGGHVLYYVIEGLRGRPLSQKAMARANMVGLALLMSLLVFATLNDVQRFRGDKKAAQVEKK